MIKKHIFILSLFFVLAACTLAKQDETYSHEEICAGLKRRMIYATMNPNITAESMKESPAKLRQLYIENNCEEEE